MKTFETDRLIARPLEHKDLNNLVRMYQNPELMATMGGIRSIQTTQKSLDKFIAHWQKHGFGVYAIFDKAGNFIGRAGLRYEIIDGKQHVEILYAFLPAYWGKGLATELAQKLVRIAFKDLGLAELIGFTLTTNKASRHVLKKAGFIYQKDFMHADLPHALYKLAKEDFYQN